MIIDSHAHIGSVLNFNMPSEMLLEAMDKYGIDFALISNVQSAEVGHDQVMIPNDKQISQQQSLIELLDVLQQSKEKLGGLVWVKPLTETITKEFETLIEQNLAYIYGIKFHPYHSKIALNSEEVKPYLALAEKFNLPIVTHTAADYESSPKVVYEVAKQYPNLDFIMVHLGLGTDHEEAINYMASLPNLYGDLTWVTPDNVLKAIEVCGSHKLMFGTDAPINGVDTYDDQVFYQFYFEDMKQVVTTEVYEQFMYKNAMKVFRLKTVNEHR
ncbi:MAG TPA: metal-dependent hydrolase [Firmicutes bacterium]|nr:metal-dependent hydrolase [Bacillota bacterium]